MNFFIRKRYIAAITGCLFAIAAAGCGGSGIATSVAAVGGSVGDGPIINGTGDITDVNGNTVVTAAAIGADSKYAVNLPAGTVCPCLFTLKTGTDSVTGNTNVADTLTSIILNGQTTANVSPITTMLTSVALSQAGGIANVTAATLSTAEGNVVSALGLGASSITAGASLLTTPSTSLTAADMAIILKANEALGELLNRAVAGATTAGTTRAQVLAALASDLEDGKLDGAKAGVALTGASAQIAADAIQAKASVATELAAGTLNLGATALAGTGGTAKTIAAIMTASAAAIPTTLTLASVQAVQATAGATAIAAIKTAADVILVAGGGTAGGAAGIALAGGVVPVGVQNAATTAASFKLAANTAAVTDFHASPTVRSTVTSAAGTVAANALAGVNPTTALRATNLISLAAATPTGTAPQIQFTLANLPVGAGIATVTALLKDGTTATRTTSQRQLQVVFDVDWNSDGTTLNLNAATGSATATYFIANGTVAVTATLTNAAANVLSAGTSVTAPTGGGTIINAAISNLFSSTGLGTALNALNLSAGQNFYYSLAFTNFPILDSTGTAFTSVNGTFSLQ